MTRIAVFASGNGSNFQAIADAVEKGTLDATIALVICDRPGAYVLERAEKAGIDVIAFRAKEFESKAAYEAMLRDRLQEAQVEWLVLAGYMRLIGTVLLQSYPNRIVNIHPSLLPAFPGKDAVGQALAYGVKMIGVTVHYVDEGMDTGTIISQDAFSIAPDATKDAIEQQIHSIEHTLYPKTLQQLFSTASQPAG